jgi:hypothetical protein
MKKIFFHIGVHKTGTTALQMFLQNSYSDLKQRGILFPQSGRVNDSNHSHIAWEFSKKPGYDPQLGGIDAVLDEIFSSECPVSIISGEDFEFLSIEQISEFHSKVQGKADIKVIVYLRRQDEVIQSEYSEWAKRGLIDMNFNWLCKYFSIHPRFFYHNLLKNWSVHFEKTNIIARIYHKKKLLNGDIIDDFFSAIGLESKIIGLDRSNEKVNESLRHKTLLSCILANTIINVIDKNKLKFNRDQIMYRIIQLGNDEFFNNDQKFSGFTNETRNSFLKNFIESNRYVAETFFPKDVIDLFPEPSQRTNEKNPDLSKAEIDRIHTWFDRFIKR